MPLDSRELDRRVTRLRKSLKGFPRNPAVDEVHDLRTRTRRVESILNALQVDSSGREAKLRTRLKTIRKRAGKVRDMDVLTSHVVGLGLRDDPGCVVRLVHHLGAIRQRGAAKLHASVCKNASYLRKGLKKERGRLQKALDSFAKAGFELDSRGNPGGAEAPLHAATVVLRLSGELARLKRLGRDKLHAYRLEVKRLRYVLEMAESEDRAQHKFLDTLKQVQDSIGEWHDWLELAAIAQDTLRHHRGCQLVKKIQATAERKFGEALEVTEQMRHRYLLSPPSRSRKGSHRRAKPIAISGPVLLAASEIAA